MDFSGIRDYLGRGMPFPMMPRMDLSDNGTFSENYRCYSFAMIGSMSEERARKLDYGGKVFLPGSALEKLANLNISYPMLFKISHTRKQKTTHCGVLEFVAEEGRIYLPSWMMQLLLLNEGDIINITSTDLPLGSFVRLQPQSEDFLNISNPKAVLENEFRNFSCLTKGDVLAIYYNSHAYELTVLETRPGNAISIVEADVEVEFSPPVGYEEKLKEMHAKAAAMLDAKKAQLLQQQQQQIQEEQAPQGFLAFSGQGKRLSGRAVPRQETNNGAADLPNHATIDRTIASKAMSIPPRPPTNSLASSVSSTSSAKFSPSTPPAAAMALPKGKLMFGGIRPSLSSQQQQQQSTEKTSNSTSSDSSKSSQTTNVQKGFTPFSGSGQSLKKN